MSDESKEVSDSGRPPELPRKPLAPSDAYKVVTDTVVGPNVRVKDNLYQAVAIVVCLILGAAIGGVTVEDRQFGALVGGFAGLLAGLFGSGIFLMIFRAVRHARGRHD
jgi:hypothetical protein